MLSLFETCLIEIRYIDHYVFSNILVKKTKKIHNYRNHCIYETIVITRQQLFRPIYDAPALSIFDVSDNSISLSVLILEQHLIIDAPASLIPEISTNLIVLSVLI